MARLLLPLIVITIFMSFFRLGSVTLFDVDEAVFSEATKEMVESGDWITPTYNGENRYDKPILLYWLMAASYKLFGINEFGARFPSAIASFFLTLSVFFFVRHFHGDKSAFHASISLILSVYLFVYSHAAVTDMALTLFITLSLFSFYLSIKENRHFIYGFYVFSALAFLTKGLIGIVFPFGIALIYILFAEGFRGVKKVISMTGIILFIIVAGPWYMAQIAINGQEFIQQFFIKHHLKRYTDVISSHKGPIYYYVPALIIGLMPWIAFLPSGIRNAFKGKDSLGLLSFIWLAFIFAFFSFSVTKLPNYILPLVPAATILISSGISTQDRWSQSAKIFIAIISALTGIGFLMSKKYLLQSGIHDTSWTITAASIMFVMSLISLYSIKTKRIPFGYMSAIMAAFLIVLSLQALPIANDYLQRTLYRYSLMAKDRLRSGDRTITYQINNPSILFYSGHKIISPGNRDELLELIKHGKENMAITKSKEIEVFRELGFNLVEKDEKYAILQRK